MIGKHNSKMWLQPRTKGNGVRRFEEHKACNACCFDIESTGEALGLVTSPSSYAEKPTFRVPVVYRDGQVQFGEDVGMPSVLAEFHVAWSGTGFGAGSSCPLEGSCAASRL